MEMELLIGQQRVMDGETRKARGGSYAEQIASEFGAKYFEQTIRGNSFVWSTTTAASITALGNNIPSLWNPLGSGIITVITKVTLQVGAIGTPAVSGLQYGFLNNAGAQIGTAGPVLTATLVAGVNTCVGRSLNGIAPKTLFAPAAITFTTAPALLGPTGFNLGSTGTETPYNLIDEIDGRIVLYPGGLLQLGASTTTSKTFNVAFWGYELQMPMLAA